jgi:Domain of unknown function (DUF7007)
LIKERRKNIMLTPWGISSHQTQITNGVWLVDTASHGGILVRRRVAHTLLTPEAIARGMSWASWLVYEEDCDWSLFAYEQPLLYAAACTKQGYPPRTAEEMQQAARECLLLWHPDYLARAEKGA